MYIVKPMIFSLCACVLAHADQRAEKIKEAKESKYSSSFFTFQLDNDLFRDTDQNYTNGIKFQYGRQFVDDENLNLFERSMKNMLDSCNFDAKESRDSIYDWSVSLQQTIFTPNSIQAITPPPGERPYSGWLGIEYAINKHDAQTSSGFSVSIGTTGDNSLARSAQDEVHRIRGIELFQGWDTQTPAEFTFNLHFNRKHRINRLQKIDVGALEFDGFLEYGASLGNLRTAAYGGVMYRAGYNLPVDYSIPRLQAASTPPSFYLDDDSSDKSFSAYVFASLRASVVAHDISLDGPVFRDHTFTVDSKPLVGELIYGAGIRYKHLSLVYARTIRTDEFHGQSLKNHQFGSLQVGLNFRF